MDIADYGDKYNCSLYTNVTGTWKVNKTIEIQNSYPGFIRLYNVPQGTYKWTVNCSNAEGMWYPRNAPRGGSKGYWILYVIP
jgi:hypothetical protein